MALLRVYPTITLPLSLPYHVIPSKPKTFSFSKFTVRNSNLQMQLQPHESHKLVVAVKEKLEKEHHSLPVGKNGRDDEDMILWFLKDRKFSVEDAVSKLTKAIISVIPKKCIFIFNSFFHLSISAYSTKQALYAFHAFTFILLYKKWRQDFGVSELTEDAVKDVAQTGKAFVHDFLDINGRPVLVVVASKHFPEAQDPIKDERLCTFLIEKALSKLPPGKEQILGIIDLRGFGTQNADLRYLTFLLNVFYYYYPKRLAQILFVDAPFVFKPMWQLVKPLLKSYTSLVRFCSVDTVRKEYFTKETLPSNFRD
ncbi:hypothetical protein Lal_00050079 [Lupinus albus]|nr:hypothetical protein Lal_00050079 [Lupinus albus]